MNDTQQATEVWTVPGWDEELRCESRHTVVVNGNRRPDGSTCSVSVTHKYTQCDHTMLICSNRADSIAQDMSVPGYCEGCGKKVSECWTVRPI